MSTLDIGRTVERAIGILLHKQQFNLDDIRREVISIYRRSGAGNIPAYVEMSDGAFMSLDNFIKHKIGTDARIG